MSLLFLDCSFLLVSMYIVCPICKGHGNGPCYERPLITGKNPYVVYIDTCTGDQIFTVIRPYRVNKRIRVRVSYDLWISCCSPLLLLLFSVIYNLCIPDMDFSCY